ncbi:hypothetical protein [Tenacibaculum sp. 190524A05c]|uniref:Uncharacterized protein n=1 Tax=Tenacibaculum platacis TaxID=3137852 RepID=A0ABM9NQW0_9FLAO
MKIKLLCVLLVIGAFTFAQTTNNQNPNKLVPGTHIYISPPKNYKPSKDFIGFKDENSIIQFYDLFGGSFYSNAKDFTRENFERNGITVMEFKDLKVDNYPAKMALLKVNQNQISLQIVFGDSDFSVMAMAILSSFEKNKLTEIKNSFFNITYDKNRKVDPFEIAFFKIDESKSAYKFSRATSNVYLYTKNGMKKETHLGDSFYTITQLPHDPARMDPELIVNNSLSSLKSKGLIISEKMVSKRNTLNGAKCYETLIIGILNSKKVYIKAIGLVKGSRAILINAIAKNDYETTLKEFEKLTKEIKLN